MTKTPAKKLSQKQLLEKFWELSRSRQEAFLKELHAISPQNKDFFQIWLGKNNAVVLESLKQEIQKETIQRIPRYRKIRLSKINEILRNSDKYALSMLEQIHLKNEAWKGILAFVSAKKWLPERYEVACCRHIDQYITMVRHHVLEKSEQEHMLQETQNHLESALENNPRLRYVYEIYHKHF